MFVLTRSTAVIKIKMVPYVQLYLFRKSMSTPFCMQLPRAERGRHRVRTTEDTQYTTSLHICVFYLGRSSVLLLHRSFLSLLRTVTISRSRSPGYHRAGTEGVISPICLPFLYRYARTISFQLKLFLYKPLPKLEYLGIDSIVFLLPRLFQLMRNAFRSTVGM